jgi:hypothetical protein
MLSDEACGGFGLAFIFRPAFVLEVNCQLQSQIL